MSDRALLEMAAKAAGYNVRWHEILECFVHVGPFNITNPPTMAGQRLVWVPLHNDGDALRLAVALGLLISPVRYQPGENAYGFVGVAWYGQRERFESERFTDDPLAATRRAITRAAAEIGKGMP